MKSNTFGPATFAGLLLLAAILLGSSVLSQDAPSPEHAAGRAVAAGTFFAAYSAILLRLAQARRASWAWTALWLPVVLAAALVLALVAAATVGALRGLSVPDPIEADGPGELEAALEGAMSLVPAVAILMIATPLLVPARLLLTLPELLRSDLRRGSGSVGEYADARAEHDERDEGPDVLLVEDDHVCATVALRFCTRHGLACRHVETLADADRLLAAHGTRIRLVLLDLFVRVQAGDPRETGAEWLAELEARAPRARRTFRVVVISGHAHYLGQAAGYADLVLEKPWNPSDLERFLRDQGILDR